MASVDTIIKNLFGEDILTHGSCLFQSEVKKGYPIGGQPDGGLNTKVHWPKTGYRPHRTTVVSSLAPLARPPDPVHKKRVKERRRQEGGVIAANENLM